MRSSCACARRIGDWRREVFGGGLDEAWEKLGGPPKAWRTETERDALLHFNAECIPRRSNKRDFRLRSSSYGGQVVASGPPLASGSPLQLPWEYAGLQPA